MKNLLQQLKGDLNLFFIGIPVLISILIPIILYQNRHIITITQWIGAGMWYGMVALIFIFARNE